MQKNNPEINLEYRAYLQGQVVAICEAVLNEEIGIIAGSRRLWRLGHNAEML